MKDRTVIMVKNGGKKVKMREEPIVLASDNWLKHRIQIKTYDEQEIFFFLLFLLKDEIKKNNDVCELRVKRIKASYQSLHQTLLSTCKQWKETQSGVMCLLLQKASYGEQRNRLPAGREKAGEERTEAAHPNAAHRDISFN